MKTKAFLLVIAALIMSACELPKENKVERVFREYVHTDFGNPSDFVSITKVEELDTFDAKQALKLVNNIDSIKWIMSDDMVSEYERKKRKLIEDNPCVISYKLNVRMKNSMGEKVIKNFWVIENNGVMTVQDHELQMDEMPDSYTDFLKTSEKYINGFIKLMKMYK